MRTVFGAIHSKSMLARQKQEFSDSELVIESKVLHYFDRNAQNEKKNDTHRYRDINIYI